MTHTEQQTHTDNSINHLYRMEQSYLNLFKQTKDTMRAREYLQTALDFSIQLKARILNTDPIFTNYKATAC